MKIRHFSYVRMLGLFLVLIYHFYPKVLQGGYIGVDVFFTFSGYLITALALRELKETHDFSIRKFAERRFFRIMPTMLFAMLTVLPFTLFGTSDLRYQLKEQVFAGLGFFSNFYEMSTGVSYENSFAPHIWVHLWSLALEIQFYAFWGFLIWFFVRVLRHRAIRGQVFLISFVLFTASSLFMLFSALGLKEYSSIYYNTLTHIFPFFIGAMLAAVAGVTRAPLVRNLAKKMSLSRLVYFAAGAAALLVVLSLAMNFNNKFAYLFGFSIASFVTAALILFLRVLHEKTEAEEPRIVKAVSDISYGVYIFHWAFLIIFLNWRLNHELAVLLTVILSFSLAAIMYYLIDPLVRGRVNLDKFEAKLRRVPIFARRLPARVGSRQVAANLRVEGEALDLTEEAATVTNPEVTVSEAEDDRLSIWEKKLRETKKSRARLGFNLVPLVLIGLLMLFLVPSVMALASSTQETVLEDSLWTGGVVQSSQQLALLEKRTELGTVGMTTLVIGDSVTMGARPIINQQMPDAFVDAVGSRNITDSLSAELNNYMQFLPSTVNIVIALGTNSIDPTRDIQVLTQVINQYSSKHRIVLVTPANWSPGGPYNSDKIADWELSIKGKYPNVYVADWRGATQGHLDWFSDDGIHIANSIPGRNTWVQLVEEALTGKNTP